MKKRYRMLIGVVVGLIAITSIAVYALRPVDPFAADAVTDPPFTSLTYSIQVFHWWDSGHVGLELDWAQRVLNIPYIKQTFAWRDLQPAPDTWDFTQSDRLLAEIERRDLRLIARLGQVPQWATTHAINDADGHDAPPTELEQWVTYCATIAERYQGRIVAYQIWNEPNLAREWGQQRPDPSAYVDLLGACSQAIRQADPAAIIISAGLAPTGNNDAQAMRDDLYLDAMYQQNFQIYVDAVGVHAPGWFAPPTYGPDDAQADGYGRWASFRRVEDLRKIMVQHGDAARQMAILEFGWTTDSVNEAYAWFAVTEEQQAQYIVEAYEYAYENWYPWVGLMSLIYFPKPVWTAQDEEYWWAITTPAGDLRPAFFALAQMDRYCGDRIISGWKAEWTEEEYDERRIPCY